MTPLVLLLLLAFLMVIAASLMIWAALTVGDARARAMRAGTNEAAAPRSALSEPRSATSAGRSAAGRAPASGAGRTNEAPIPSSRGGDTERERERAVARRADELVTPARPDAPEVPLRPSNDDVRGARAVVTPRTRSDDAFERFLEGETKDRGFPPIRPDERRES